MVLHKMNIYVSFCSCPSISSNSRSRTEAMITLNIFTLLMMVPVYFPKMFQSLPPTIFGVFVDPHSWQYWLPPIILQFSITKERARLKLKENKKEGKEGGCEISCFAFSVRLLVNRKWRLVDTHQYIFWLLDAKVWEKLGSCCIK